MVLSKENVTEGRTMATTEKMTIDERRKYIGLMQERYWKGSRKERSGLLDEMEAVTEMHRKSLLRLLRRGVERQPRQRQRGRHYGAGVDDALRVITESFDYVCAERLQPNLVWMAQHLAEHGELAVTGGLLEQLAEVSVPTVRRIVQRLEQDQPRLPRKKPAVARGIGREIPAKRIAWDEAEPGHFEVDLVHHSGPVASGQYLCTLQMVDVATGWSERMAILGRSYLVMKDAFERILLRLPFAVRELHPDNGSEFLNQHLLRFWPEAMAGVHLSRSRPYQKNDNRFVEQKNATLVRAYLGHERLDTVQQTLALNQLYDQMWLYYNFFQPVLRLKQKTVHYDTEGFPKIKRCHHPAQTPFDRLCATQTLTAQQQAQLIALRQQTNPRQLRQQIYRQIDAIFALPLALPGQTEDVYETLLPSQTLSTSPDCNNHPMKGEGGPVALSFDRTTPLR
jgi:hypothetical protein